MFNGNLKNYMVSAGLYFAAPLGLAVASAFAETWQFAAVLVALLLLWLVLFASLRTGVFARFVLYAMLPVLTVAFSAQQMWTLGAVSLCSFAVFTAIYLPRDECLTFLRVLRFLALAVIIPVAVLFCWFAFTGFLPMLTGFILLIGWIAWFFLTFPAAFAWVSLWGLFPLLTAISWIRASEPSDFVLTTFAFVAWLGLFAAKDWRRAVRTLLRAIAPTFIIVFAFVYSGAAVIWISSAIALAWVVGYLLFDRRELARISLGLVVPGIIVGVWYLATLSEGAVIPSIPEVLDVVFHPFREPPNLDSRPFFDNILISFLRVLVGFLFAVITGVPLGLLIGYSRLFERVFSPVIEMARPICPIAWLPVAIILFGLASFGSSIWGNASYRYDVFDQMKYAMVFIIWWGAFFPIVINTVDGVRGVKKLFIDAAKVLGLDEKGIFFRVIFPASLPSVMTGLRVGMGIAWMVIVAAEFFPGTTSGLGYMITTSHQVAEYEYAFASILAIGVTGLAINKLMMLLSVRVGKWEALER